MLSVFALYGPIFFNTTDAGNGHILGDFYGIGAPGGYHFAARSHEIPLKPLLREHLGASVEPREFFQFLRCETLRTFCGNNAAVGCFEECDHVEYLITLKILYYCRLPKGKLMPMLALVELPVGMPCLENLLMRRSMPAKMLKPFV